MHSARGTCVPACADAPSLGIISAARAGHAFLRAQMLKGSVSFALRARGMRPCVRGCSTFRFHVHCARGECVPARVDAQRLRII